MRRLIWKAALCLIIATLAAPAWANEVIAISDGDSINIISPSGRKLRVRLFGIDCPELDQPYGQDAREYVQQLEIMGKSLHLEPMDIDRHRRLVAIVRIDQDSRPLEELLLESGLAWVYPAYCTHPICESWLLLEEEAREARRGLWQDMNPVPPWEWRKRGK